MTVAHHPGPLPGIIRIENAITLTTRALRLAGFPIHIGRTVSAQDAAAYKRKRPRLG